MPPAVVADGGERLNIGLFGGLTIGVFNAVAASPPNAVLPVANVAAAAAAAVASALGANGLFAGSTPFPVPAAGVCAGDDGEAGVVGRNILPVPTAGVLPRVNDAAAPVAEGVAGNSEVPPAGELPPNKDPSADGAGALPAEAAVARGGVPARAKDELNAGGGVAVAIGDAVALANTFWNGAGVAVDGEGGAVPAAGEATTDANMFPPASIGAGAGAAVVPAAMLNMFVVEGGVDGVAAAVEV